jgi:hypothetical protein
MDRCADCKQDKLEVCVNVAKERAKEAIEKAEAITESGGALTEVWSELKDIEIRKVSMRLFLAIVAITAVAMGSLFTLSLAKQDKMIDAIHNVDKSMMVVKQQVKDHIDHYSIPQP